MFRYFFSFVCVNTKANATAITITIQAQDVNNVNLPRVVTFTGTMPNSTAIDLTSNSSAAVIFTTTYGSHTIHTWWGTNIINASLSYSATATATVNITTYIQRLNWVDNYVLISLNNTSVSAPTLQGESDIFVPETTASGSLQLLIDHANWKTTTEPAKLEIGTRQYNKGDGTWSWTNSILSLTDAYSGSQAMLLTFSTVAGGGGGATTQPSRSPSPSPSPNPSHSQTPAPVLPSLPEV